MTNMLMTLADYLTAPLVTTLLIAPLAGMFFNEEETDND